MQSKLMDAIAGIAVGTACVAIGIISTRLFTAGTGDWMQFAGALFGAAASVMGAYAVAEYVAARGRREAMQQLRVLVEELEGAVVYLADVAILPVPVDPMLERENQNRVDISLLDLANFTSAITTTPLLMQAQSPKATLAVLRIARAIQGEVAQLDATILARREGADTARTHRFPVNSQGRILHAVRLAKPELA
jgi:hypothetical protein